MVAVQVAPAVKPVTVKTAGEPSRAVPRAGSTLPLSQVRLTATLLVLPSVNFLPTENVVELSVLVIVQERFSATATLRQSLSLLV